MRGLYTMAMSFCLSVRLFVCLSPVKLVVKLFATWQHLAVSGGLIVSTPYTCFKTYKSRGLKTTHDHMMAPPLQTCNGLAGPAGAACCMYGEICEIIRYVAAPV